MLRGASGGHPEGIRWVSGGYPEGIRRSFRVLRWEFRKPFSVSTAPLHRFDSAGRAAIRMILRDPNVLISAM
jgi:hypothetical protein